VEIVDLLTSVNCSASRPPTHSDSRQILVGPRPSTNSTTAGITRGCVRSMSRQCVQLTSSGELLFSLTPLRENSVILTRSSRLRGSMPAMTFCKIEPSGDGAGRKLCPDRGVERRELIRRRRTGELREYLGSGEPLVFQCQLVKIRRCRRWWRDRRRNKSHDVPRRTSGSPPVRR